MAKMIPDFPKEFDPRSHEGVIFEELNDLPEDYYVFHSFEIVSIKGNVITESEIDFVIFHPKKGLICLEAKAGQVMFENGYWQYGSGKRMKHDGPYIQAKRNKWKLNDYMNEHGLKFENEHCKKLHAVWFPDVPLSKFQGQVLPAEGDVNITLTSDSFGRIEECIENIFRYDGQDRRKTCLSENDAKRILERALAPTFSLISLQEIEKEHTKNVFKRMLKEQVSLLNYLEEQNNAIINGLAGTGKTVMAIEKARRHSEKGENVLFLCYNSFLNEHLRESYPYKHVFYYTIDGLACKLCETKKQIMLCFRKNLKTCFVMVAFHISMLLLMRGKILGRQC